MVNMVEATQPSTANIAAACAILAGVTGYMLGQAKSLGFFGGSPVLQPTGSEKERADDSGDESSDEEEDSTPAEFPGQEECKMVLVVRTDLGMTKGITAVYCSQETWTNLQYRQDWRTVWARDTGLLQALPSNRARLQDTPALGTTRASQGCFAGQK
jgi:hypothetical protein